MKCPNCGRPIGKSRQCTYCQRQKTSFFRKNRRLLVPTLIAAVCVIAAVILGIIFLGGDDVPQTNAGQTVGKHHVEIELRDFGTISVELDADAAPVTVENFMKLANEGFYDGLTFHRIQQGFMMQGGDPLGTGTGGADKTIKGEFTANGVQNPLSHTRGAISMARSSAYDSASSQFFICDADATFLDGQYACFGYVMDGMDVVDAVCAYALQVERDSNYILGAADQPVITTVRVID